MEFVYMTVKIPEDLKKELMDYAKQMSDEKDVLARGTQTSVIREGLRALKEKKS